LLRAGERINQLTTDHTLVEQLVQEGRLSRDEIPFHPQRSVITRAIGVDLDIDVDTLPPLALQLGDQVLLCSDGLSGPVSDEQIADILLDEADGDAACRALLEAANAAGGPDNITVVLLRVIDPAEQTPAAGTAVGATTTADLGQVRGGGVATAVDARAPADAPAAPSDAQTAADGYDAQPATRPRRRGVRVVVGVLVVAALLGVGVAAGYVLLSRSYFVGDDTGRVAIFRGLPQAVAGVPLSWVVERSDLATADLPPIRQDRLRSGLSFASLSEARRYVEVTLRADARAAEDLLRGAPPSVPALPGTDPSSSPSPTGPRLPAPPGGP
jgi:protein phosphatase